MKLARNDIREIFRTPQRKSYTIVGLTIITITFFVVFAIRPTISKIVSIQTNTKALEDLEKQVDNKLETLDRLIEQRESNKEILDIFHRNFPEDKETALLVANFEKISEKYELLLTSVKFETVKDATVQKTYYETPAIGVLDTTITVEGDLQDINDYIKHLEQYPRIMYVDSFNVTPINQGTRKADKDRVGYSAVIQLSIFQYKPISEDLEQ